MTQDYNQREAELQDQLRELNLQRENAQKAARQDKLDKLIDLQQEATEYRSQAAVAPSDAEKQNLYRYAASADRQANDIRAELGLELNPVEPEPAPVDPTEEIRDKANGVINSLLFIALSTGASLLTSDYIAGIRDGGIVAFLLHTVARLSYAGFLVSAVLWASLRAVVWFIPDYFPVKLYEDFTGAEPKTRLYILAGFAVSVLFLLSTIGHAK